MPNRHSGKGSKATPNRQPSAQSGPKGSFTPVRIATVVGIGAMAISAAAYLISGNRMPVQSKIQAQPAPVSTPAQPTAAPTEAPAATIPAAQQSTEAPPAVALKPHPQRNLPPLPLIPTPPARPIEVVRAVYRFAAEHPEVLSYVPCYCGCEREGHRGSEDCFVTQRDAAGDVVGWEPHGMT